MPDIYVAPKKKSENNQSQKAKPSKQEGKKPQKRVVKETKAPIFSAFITRPKDIRFETQEYKEKIVLLLRRHWITNVTWVFLAFLMILAPAVLRFFPPLDLLPWRYRFILIIAWYLLTIAFVFEKFLSWYFNVNIITDERIIDIDFPTLLYRDITSTKIDQIQDVSAKIGGFARSLFDFGDVKIQTAGAIPEICFEAIPHPARVSETINEQIIEEEQEKLDGRVR